MLKGMPQDGKVGPAGGGPPQPAPDARVLHHIPEPIGSLQRSGPAMEKCAAEARTPPGARIRCGWLCDARLTQRSGEGRSAVRDDLVAGLAQINRIADDPELRADFGIRDALDRQQLRNMIPAADHAEAVFVS